MDHQYVTSIRGRRECFFFHYHRLFIEHHSSLRIWFSTSISNSSSTDDVEVCCVFFLSRSRILQIIERRMTILEVSQAFESYLRNSCPVKAELSFELKCNGNANRGFNGTSKRNYWSLNKKHIRKGVFHFEHNKITILEMKVTWSQIKQNHGVYLFITIRLALSHGYLKWCSLLGSKVWRTLSCIFLDMACHCDEKLKEHVE